MGAVLHRLRARAFGRLAATLLAVMSPLAASTIACAPLPLPDGRTVPGPCEDGSWFPQPPWYYLPSTPPLPEPPPLPPFAYLLDPGPPLPPSDFLLIVYGPDGTPGSFPAEPPAYLFVADPPDFSDPAPEHAPEPGGLALIGLGLLVLGILGRRRKGRPPG